jgi:thiosulfate/3-mercaptopyruvate sulfurtransferase
MRALSVLRRLAMLVLAAPAALWAGVLPGPVVDAAWLKAHLDDVVVVDVRSDTASWSTEPQFHTDAQSGGRQVVYVGGHIDGARRVDFGQVRVDRMVNGHKIGKLLPDAAHVQALMRAAGVPKGKPLVITSVGEAPFEIEEAARLYWTLKYYGASEMALLDGGHAAWLQAGNPFSISSDQPQPGDWTAGSPQQALLAEVPQVQAAIEDRTQIVDARPLAQYLGLVFKKPSVIAGGHLPGARNLPTDIRFKTEGVAQRFWSADAYRHVFAAQGIRVDTPTVTYCNSGHMAAGSWFIHSEILGNPGVRLYDGSMHEWTTLGHPVVGPSEG